MILVAATLSHELLSAARQHVLALKKVTSKDLHRVLPHVEQVFFAVEAQEKAGVCVHQLIGYPRRLPLALIPTLTLHSDRLLNILLKKGLKRTMVFCNTVPSCDWTAHCLKDKGLVAVKLHGNVPMQVRQARPAVVGDCAHVHTHGFALHPHRSAVSACSDSDLETAEF